MRIQVCRHWVERKEPTPSCEGWFKWGIGSVAFASALGRSLFGMVRGGSALGRSFSGISRLVLGVARVLALG